MKPFAALIVVLPPSSRSPDDRRKRPPSTWNPSPSSELVGAHVLRVRHRGYTVFTHVRDDDMDAVARIREGDVMRLVDAVSCGGAPPRR
jgi:hypothetical protein